MGSYSVPIENLRTEAVHDKLHCTAIDIKPVTRSRRLSTVSKDPMLRSDVTITKREINKLYNNYSIIY